MSVKRAEMEKPNEGFTTVFHSLQLVESMSRNARTRSQLLSVYYNFTPFHARFLNVLLSMGIKIQRALATKYGPEVHNAPIQL